MGVHGIIIQKRNACQITDIVEKTAAGAVNYMRVARVTNITRAIDDLKKYALESIEEWQDTLDDVESKMR